MLHDLNLVIETSAPGARREDGLRHLHVAFAADDTPNRVRRLTGPPERSAEDHARLPPLNQANQESDHGHREERKTKRLHGLPSLRSSRRAARKCPCSLDLP